MKKKKTKKSKSNLQKAKLEEQIVKSVNSILDLLESFCEKYLNEEYWELCHDMTIEIYEMGAPLDKGKPQSWASGIVHAIGFVNFLGDQSFEPYMESSKIAQAFGVSQQTMQTKSKIIRDEMDMFQLDPNWCLPSRLIKNPLVWMFETVGGFIADIRDAPREVQEQAYQNGMIPFIPADHKQQEPESKSENKINIIEFPSGGNKKTEFETKSVSEQKDSDPTLFDHTKK